MRVSAPDRSSPTPRVRVRRAASALALGTLAVLLPFAAPAVRAGDPPPSPAGLRAVAYSPTAGAIAWRRSDDARRIVGYEVSRDGAVLGTVDALSYVEPALRPGTRYRYTVTAVEATGQRSAAAAVTLVTPALPGGGGHGGGGGKAPAAPKGLRAAVYSATAAELFWHRPATVGLRYEVRRDGTTLATIAGTSYFDDALSSDVGYRYAVVAIDRQGRRSAPAAVSLRTFDDGSGGGGGGGAAPTIAVDNYERVLRDVVRFVNERPFERVLETRFALDAGGGVTLIAGTEGLTRESLPPYPDPSAIGSFGGEALNEPIERSDYGCAGGGSLAVYRGNFPSGVLDVAADCTVGDVTLDGATLRRSSPGRPFAAVVGVAERSVSALDGSATRTLASGGFGEAALSFVTDSAVRRARDVVYHETVAGETTRVDGFSSTIAYDAPAGTLGVARSFGYLADGSPVELYLQQTSTTLDGTFEITAPWSDGAAARVSVGLAYEDEYWYSAGWYPGVTSEALGLTRVDGSPLPLDFERDRAFYWKRGELGVTAADGSALVLTPRDATTFTVRVGETELVRRWDEPGFAINCEPLGPRDEIGDCSLADQFGTP